MTLFTRRFNNMFKNSQFSLRQGRRNFGKDKESNKDPIICFECKKSGHIKVACLKLRKDSWKDKKSYKENFEKFKKAFAALGESDFDTFNDEPSDEEVANLHCQRREN